MRITNNMMMHNSTSNINGNKINVDMLNSQMSSQKKIQRPSEDPVIAVRALRLRSSLSEIEQYYENNIPDAESWMDITQTSLKNMQEILKNVRSQCVYGSTDSLKTEDRNTILSQLQKLREQIYEEGNADYAGRTVFTGYRTDQKLTFMTPDPSAKYDITQSFSYKNIEEHRYYGQQVTLPTTADEVLNNAIQDPNTAAYDRFRLGYGKIDSIVGKDGLSVPRVDPGDVDVNETVIGYSYTDPVTGDRKDDGEINVTVYKTYAEWAEASADGTYEIDEAGGASAVFIQESGELVLGKDASSALRSGKAELDLDYTKTGFDKGEVRPEYYYNCTDVTDPANPVEYVKYKDGREVYQDINYVVGANQTITVNTNASDVFDSAIGRDVDELIEAVQNAIAANKKVEDLEAMKGMQEYASDACQDKLDVWIEAAKKEVSYAEDNMKKLYDSYIGNCDKYLEKVDLALTNVGSKGASLDLIKNRMSNEQLTVKTLKSTNEDRELSDIIIDFTASYSAYQASLQAASKINQNTLLNYL